jgi:hypothetical protein
MKVVAHHRIGGDIDGEHRRQLPQALDDPAAPVLEVAAGVAIHAAEIRAPDAQRETTWYQKQSGQKQSGCPVVSSGSGPLQGHGFGGACENH